MWCGVKESTKNSCSAENAGVQVLRLGEGERRYELNEAALRRVLLHPDVRHLPVVVVSVAGAYRSGKSFILDFFLRYLTASRCSQLSGDWLGTDDERLQGFHWRGGGERDTTGIHLWPHPIITTMESTGEKVAVLLMDTQGTFDSESTIGQNSTIFALSTLMSSVQIYNLSSNIREDDLQHLQLFTEYGKLACDAGSRAFQTLTFLVRDWPHAYEHAHGFQGGAAILAKRLQSRPNQKAELREVREHIRSCFDKIKCFLMPHPGLAVENETFSGCLKDMTEKFIVALLELVPSMFDPKHLTPKLINGEPVRTEDLFEYFRKYVEIFNSDEMPEAVTIFKATADACLLAAVRAARVLYEARMQEHVSETISVTDATLDAWHAAARKDALQAFSLKKKLGSPAAADAAYNDLINELDACLLVYKLTNDEKVRDLTTRAKEAYDSSVSNVCADHTLLCLHPLDLEELHADSVQVAIILFKSGRAIADNEEDVQKATLMKSLEEQFKQLSFINEHNNKSAVEEARNHYVTLMKLEMKPTGVSSNLLEAGNQATLQKATAFFAKKRNRPTERDEDSFKDQLIHEISNCYADFVQSNANSNAVAIQAAENQYNNHIAAARGRCFEPQALRNLHEEAVKVAVSQFMANRAECANDDFKLLLMKNLESRWLDLQRNDKYNNEQAVEQAFNVYRTQMEQYLQPSPLTLLTPVCVKLLCLMPQYHEASSNAALQVFTSMRGGVSYPGDPYYQSLMMKIQAAFKRYKHPVVMFYQKWGINI